ncbi:MAG: hypothetical protein KY440_13805 [Actinobacteria bacterium]|nr:hypothetical protein [Actinomycetota bacterium]
MAKQPRINQDLLQRQAQVAVLAGLLRGDDIDALVEAVAPSHVRGWFTPDVAVLELAVTALDLACLPGTAPLEYEGLRERYLPAADFRGRVDHRSSQYALYAAACIRGGLQPDLLNDAGWWNTPLWIYAVYALVIYARAAAERRGTTVEQLAHDLAVRHGLGEDIEGHAGVTGPSAGSQALPQPAPSTDATVCRLPALGRRTRREGLPQQERPCVRERRNAYSGRSRGSAGRGGTER